MMGEYGPSRKGIAAGRALRDAAKGPLLRVRPLFLKRLILRSESASASKGLVDHIGEMPARSSNPRREA